MTLAELIKSLVDSSKERIKNPVTGAFFISFVIYNWQAILFLLFSTASIEDKLYITKLKYCSFYAFLFPFLIAILYSISIPYINMLIEKINKKAKYARQTNIYDEKIDEVILKIKLADEELKLQDKLSRNQEKEEMLGKIKELEETLKTRSESQRAIENDYRNQISDLTKRLKDANSIKSERNKIIHELDDNIDNLSGVLLSHFNKLFEELTLEDINQLLNLKTKVTTKINTRRLSKKLLDFLINNGFAHIINSEHYFNQSGMKFKSFVEARVNSKK